MCATTVRLSRGVSQVGSISSSNQTTLSYRTIRDTTLDKVGLTSNMIHVAILLGPRIFCGILDRRANLRVNSRTKLVPYVVRLTGTGHTCRGVHDTVRRIRTANCNVIVPSVSRLSLRRPRVIQRNKQCNIHLRTDTPSVRVVGTIVRARLDPVIKARGRDRSLIRDLLGSFRSSPIHL